MKLENTKPENMNLLELKGKIIHHYQKAKNAEQKTLRHYCKCGQMLLEVRSRFKQGEWKLWLKKNFDLKYAMLSNYMLLAENWNKPYIQNGLNNGEFVKLESILDAIRDRKRTPKQKLIKKQREEFQKNIDYLCSEFKKYLKDMDSKEIVELTKLFDDDVWPQWIKIIENKCRENKIKVKTA